VRALAAGFAQICRRHETLVAPAFLKVGFRHDDSAGMAVIELVDRNVAPRASTAARPPRPRKPKPPERLSRAEIEGRDATASGHFRASVSAARLPEVVEGVAAQL
jgi:hypothetical protein